MKYWALLSRKYVIRSYSTKSGRGRSRLAQLPTSSPQQTRPPGPQFKPHAASLENRFRRLQILRWFGTGEEITTLLTRDEGLVWGVRMQ